MVILIEKNRSTSHARTNSPGFFPLELGLESDQVCSKVYPSTAPMVLIVLEVSGDSASQDPKEY